MGESYTVCPRCDYDGGYTPFHGAFQCRNANCSLFSERQYEVWKEEMKEKWEKDGGKKQAPDKEDTLPGWFFVNPQWDIKFEWRPCDTKDQ